VIALVVPLSLPSLRTLRYEQWVGDTKTASEHWAKGTDWQIESVAQVGGDIVIAAFGPGAPPPVDSLKAAIRGKVPRGIVVQMVEGSARTVGL
jgi:hypothetical protein